MSEKINHAEEARKHIERAHEQQSEEGQFQFTVRDNAMLATAEATLALVAAQERTAEMLRIGNMIAYWQLHTPRSVDDSVDNRQIEVTLLHTDDDRNVDTEIQKGLGFQ